MADKEVQTNHQKYLENYQHSIERDHAGRVALMHAGEIIDIYDDDDEAYCAGRDNYGLGRFSLEWIAQEPAQLGFFGLGL